MPSTAIASVTVKGEFSCTEPGVPKLTLSLADMPKPIRKKIRAETQNTGFFSW